MEHKEILLIKNGELALKGLNRGTFEDILLKNIKRRLYGAGSFTLRKAQSTLYIEPREEGADLEEACDRLSRIFGISAYTRRGGSKPRDTLHGYHQAYSPWEQYITFPPRY